MWPSAQQPHSIPAWGEDLIKELEKLPDEIDGIITGPNRAFEIDELRRRLVARATDTPEAIEQRVGKAAYELTFAPRFDHVVVNDDLERAKEEVYRLVSGFVNR